MCAHLLLLKNLILQMTCFRWSVLPNMSQVNAYHSALCIGDEEGGDVAILIVGGNGGTAKEAEMLTR